MSRELGDFQTPPGLVAAVLARLGPVGTRWTRVLEPTCGRGHFLAGLLDLDPPPREVHGVELQDEHARRAQRLADRAPGSVKAGVTRADLFELDLRRVPHWTESGPLLVVGNPPWVTSAELGALGRGNVPPKWNVKGARGLDAKTGASNFDLAEAVWLKLLTELADERPTVALLCKTAVARNVLEHAARSGWGVASAMLMRVDARAWFGASVEACLLCVTLGSGPGPGLERIPVFADLGAAVPEKTMGFARGRLVADLDAYAPFAFADGRCPFVWRQGLKHDAAAVMELKPDGQSMLRNRVGEPVDVEPGQVFPLLKGTDLAGADRPAPKRSVLVTQRRPGDDTERLAQDAPRLWAYLQRHAGAFAARKSSVYRGRPPFAMFGVGPYSFASWKVAVSGLHKAPRFRAVGPGGGRPVMLDDTCYFVACRTPEQAALVAALLNEPGALGLLRALAFPGAKRPVTKSLLQRLDLPTLLDRADRPALLDRAGADVERLTGRPPDWPEPLETLIEENDPQMTRMDADGREEKQRIKARKIREG
jgi:hypothetical protein